MRNQKIPQNNGYWVTIYKIKVLTSNAAKLTVFDSHELLS
jgi:hypothetical protein